MKDRRKQARERLRRRKALARQRARQKATATAADALANGRGVVFAASAKTLAGDAGNAAAPKSAGREVERERQRAIDALESDVMELSRISDPSDQTTGEIARIRREVEELKQQFYANLGAWQKLQVARHPQRPYPEDFIRLLFENFSEIHGDRNFGDDPAMLAGMAWFHGKPVTVFGTQKGRDTKQRVARNFGHVKPEGYRKALRVMNLAAKFRRPIFVFVDTPGAYPGVDAEERGQAEAIARNIREMSRLPVPIIVTITGEGGSGGALAVAVGDRVFMLENSVYSVISPEGCASIMWRDATKAEIAAEALKITATDLLELKLVDGIVPEPDGGAHADHAAAAKLLEPVLSNALDELAPYSPQQLVDLRYEKFRRMGQFFA
ncbi:MAG TPA: acetyl-CoA carboxylase carboxyltransferase subunit alpha [Candidatus Acidoferrales bacterium]|nr:acetyl-CoA carboxylase carboxyltransferase subunit alpha [Candidatus Acidoferrales bacterium]